jgi:predicted transcriptional regulator
MNETVLNHVWLAKQFELIKQGLDFPIIAVNEILLTNTEKEKSMVERNKGKVLTFISKNKKAYLSDISETFGLDSFEVKLILNQLEKEGKIKLNE